MLPNNGHQAPQNHAHPQTPHQMVHPHPIAHRRIDFTERFTRWVGSNSSLIFHTALFIAFLVAGLAQIASWNTLLLVLTTAVSLEAIYLAIFIQMTVNRNTERLHAVAEDVEDVQEDIDEIQEDVDEIQEDVAEMNEDIDELQEDVAEMSEDEKAAAEEARKQKQLQSLDHITITLQKLINEVDALKQQRSHAAAASYPKDVH